jgi:lipoate-protein ligase A
MAIDAWLLDQAVAGAGPALRFYQWQRCSVSLGFHQRRIPEHWRHPPDPELAPEGLDWVRRPSGGRAVLHAGSLTYALVWPGAPADRALAYSLACAWLRETFQSLGLPLGHGRQVATRDRASCFATGTPADLVHACGAKRIGSAQLWRRGCLLQHGSVLLQPPAPLWQWLFGEPPPALPELDRGIEALQELLRQAARAHLPCASGEMQSRSLSADELAQALALGDRYRLADAAAALAASPSFTSPELSIRRAT